MHAHHGCLHFTAAAAVHMSCVCRLWKRKIDEAKEHTQMEGHKNEKKTAVVYLNSCVDSLVFVFCIVYFRFWMNSSRDDSSVSI